MTKPTLRSEEYGIVVDLDEQEAIDPVQLKIDELHQPVSVSINLSASQKARLQRLCADANQTEAQYIQTLVIEDLGQRVGRPLINRPSQLRDTPIGEPNSIKGPVGGLVTRG
jgi:hypothetical protein